ncbi:unnamed protein product [Mytilus edulis]|uniref:Uncharacterized protein n=1 Tax=Mytilus edulis TaxID=6550 RepID=A0A8S3UG84_MYTED|nr:unnamed protein product [Mytilus edulis]
MPQYYIRYTPVKVICLLVLSYNATILHQIYSCQGYGFGFHILLPILHQIYSCQGYGFGSVVISCCLYYIRYTPVKVMGLVVLSYHATILHQIYSCLDYGFGSVVKVLLPILHQIYSCQGYGFGSVVISSRLYYIRYTPVNVMGLVVLSYSVAYTTSDILLSRLWVW